MAIVEWTGPGPRAQLTAELERRSIRLERGTRDAALRVIVSRRPPPAQADGARWIWAKPAVLREGELRRAVAAGAYDVVSIVDSEGERALLRRIEELAEPELAPPDTPSWVGRSAATQALLARIARAAKSSMPVLLTGETGTGKEVAAGLIHAWSTRASGPFVPINCAAIPDELMEGELFGYAKGAFSGAVRGYDGLMMGAAGGTVFLDEVHETPRALQAKLLRVLEDRVVSRLGENSWRKADFRLLAASNQSLPQLVARGAFGADLYERLAIVTIELPPLRERREDIPLLVEHFFERFHRDEPSPRQVRAVRPEALEALVEYPWPGNIRELRNVIFGALVAKRTGEELLLSDLPPRIWREAEEAADGIVNRGALERRLEAGTFDLRRELENLERMALSAALAKSGGSAAGAAKRLGTVGRGGAGDPGHTVRAMMRRLGVRAPPRAP